jgi:hypothetical protein
VPSADAVRLQGGDHTTGYTFTAQINDLNAELREARAQIASIRADTIEDCARIAESGLTLNPDNGKWIAKNIRALALVQK